MGQKKIYKCEANRVVYVCLCVYHKQNKKFDDYFHTKIKFDNYCNN